MLELLSAVIMTACMNFGIMLRYMPFSGLVTPAKRRSLVIIYTAASILGILLITGGMMVWGVVFAFTFLRFGGIIYSALMSLANVLVI